MHEIWWNIFSGMIDSGDWKYIMHMFGDQRSYLISNVVLFATTECCNTRRNKRHQIICKILFHNYRLSVHCAYSQFNPNLLWKIENKRSKFHFRFESSETKLKIICCNSSLRSTVVNKQLKFSTWNCLSHWWSHAGCHWRRCRYQPQLCSDF